MSEETQIHSVSEYENLLGTQASKVQDDLIRKNLKERFRPYYILTGFLFSLLLIEIFRWFTNAPPLPIIVFGLFLVSLIFSFYQLRDQKERLDFLRLGKHGEPNVANILTEYHLENANTLHRDVIIDNKEIDFIIVDHAGITLINVLELQVPAHSEAVISYDEQQVFLNGYRPEENPLDVLKSVNKMLGSKLYAAIGRSINIDSFVVFPEWFVEDPKEDHDIKIINPRQLPKLLQSREMELADNDASLLKHHSAKLFKRDNQE